MRIAVCDDEDRFRSDIRGHIDKMFGSLDVIVDGFAGGKELLAKVRRIGKGEVLLQGNISVPVSRSAAAGLKNMPYSYLEENALKKRLE